MGHPLITARSYVRTSLIALCSALSALALLVAVASAHGTDLLKSDPSAGAALAKPPAQVRAWFSDELRIGDSTLQVFDSSGEQVDNGDGGVDLSDPDRASMIVSLPPVSDDVYTVRWYAVLEDGDAGEGLFRFTVGDAQVAASQIALPQPVADDDGGGLPVVWIIAGSGMVLLGALAVVLRSRSARGS